MNNRKNYNSIVFLTTLSVYLGLVLAGGAAPSVLAQAATTRGFDIKNEIVVEDDLDKNPDDCKKLAKLAEEKLLWSKVENNSLSNFAVTLKNIILIGEEISSRDFSFNFGSKPDLDYQNFRNVSFNLSGKPVIFPKDTRSKITKEVENLINLFQKKSDSTDSNFTFSYSKDEKVLMTKATFLQENISFAHKLAVAYNASLDFQRCVSQNKTENVILQNTQITFENNQVFIVTRLPRGSIDSLLAQKDAQ
ncbi:MAG: hypothetical protein ABJA66_14310 [Actinomycetota bacterium]